MDKDNKGMQSTSRARRRLLKLIAGGGGAAVAAAALPERWIKPALEHAVLSAHAQATGLTYFGLNLPRTGTLGNTGNTLSPIAVCVSVAGAFADVSMQGAQNNIERRGTIPTNGAFGSVSDFAVSGSCSSNCNPILVRIVAMSAGSVTLDANDGPSCGEDNGFTVVVPAAPCGAFPPLTGDCGGD